MAVATVTTSHKCTRFTLPAPSAARTYPTLDNFPLDFINRNMAELKRDTPYLTYCGSGYRSVTAISILKSRGFDRLVNVEGGIKEIKETTKAPLTEFVEHATEL